MTELRPENRALFERGGIGLGPREDDRVRIERAIALQLGLGGAAALAEAAPAAHVALGKGASSSLLATVLKWTAGAMVLGGLGTVGFFATRAAEPAPSAAVVAIAPVPPASPALSASEVREPPPAPTVEAAAPSVSASSPKAPLAPQASASTVAKGSVSEEAKLLRDADAALRGGDSARALSLLDEHRRLYPNGVLVAERNVERILALCRMGRPEGKRDAVRLVKANPKSPLANSIRAACGLEPPEAPPKPSGP